MAGVYLQNIHLMLKGKTYNIISSVNTIIIVVIIIISISTGAGV
jgi:hypothetical protein